MSKRTEKLALGLAICTAPLWMGADGCDVAVIEQEPEQQDDSCWYNGKKYGPDEEFPAGDGCNTCSCAECTLINCGEGCVYEDGRIPFGETVPGGDCNTCTCYEDGTVVCTDAACAEGFCEVDGVRYDVGDEVPSDDCNSCNCDADGQVSCTAIACEFPTCEHGGQTYQAGDTFPAGDGCNSCSCGSDGLVTCTATVCDPGAGCTLGDATFAAGESVICEDGCNVCSCVADAAGNLGWASTDAACSALRELAICDDSGQLFDAAPLYLSGDVLALSALDDAPCAPMSLELCWDGTTFDSEPAQVQLWLRNPGSQPGCGAEHRQAAFDLSPFKRLLGPSRELVLRIGDARVNYTY